MDRFNWGALQGPRRGFELEKRYNDMQLTTYWPIYDLFECANPSLVGVAAPKGLMFHSDRGVQYASNAFRKVIEKNGMVQSMSRKACCWDNAVAESFFGTLKQELIYHCKFKTREEAKLAIFDYIEIFYNRFRLHSALNYQTPENVKRLALAA